MIHRFEQHAAEAVVANGQQKKSHLKYKHI